MNSISSLLYSLIDFGNRLFLTTIRAVLHPFKFVRYIHKSSKIIRHSSNKYLFDQPPLCENCFYYKKGNEIELDRCYRRSYAENSSSGSIYIYIRAGGKTSKKLSGYTFCVDERGTMSEFRCGKSGKLFKPFNSEGFITRSYK